ncbi:4288_t:CDS:2 [Paraglomus occultum]|uniref:Tubulin-specific chaperone A n=1 Tax=Paraglomus occultum TaxID=144539 RepID=A0A9N9DE03_9GLOM|nr:4288_t:CDS:2 [Paraglomus occultum]
MSLKHKIDIVKRLHADSKYYEIELQNQQRRIDKYIEENRDEYDIKKQKEVLEETQKMIPDCKNRLQKACQELQDYMDMNPALKGTAEYTTAENILKNLK